MQPPALVPCATTPEERLALTRIRDSAAHLSLVLSEELLNARDRAGALERLDAAMLFASAGICRQRWEPGDGPAD